MHRKKVLAGLFLAAGLALTLLTPRNVRADDALPCGEPQQLQDITPDDIAGDSSPPGSLEAPDDDDSGGGSTQGDGEAPGDTGDLSGGSDQNDPGGNDPTSPTDSGGEAVVPNVPDVPAEPETPEAPANPDEPETPEDSDGSEDPDGPEDPAAPGGSETPEDPDGPEDPAAPGGSETPEDPDGPEDPAAPGGPETPDDPDGPKDPAAPGGPETPEDPDGPETPEDQESPDKDTTDGSSQKDAKDPTDKKVSDAKNSVPSPAPVSVIPHLTTTPNTSGSGLGNRSVWSIGGRGRYTARFVKVAKVYAIPWGKFPVTVREEMSVRSRAVGKVPGDGLVFILADEDEKWFYVESGDVRGFVLKSLLETGDEVKSFVEEKGEEAFAEAAVLVDPSENKAFTYTRTTTNDSKGFLTELRAAIIEKSEEYLGGPYVWGGTSLTGGCDCSGFIQSLFGLFGVELPRTSREQAVAGEPIPLSEVEPGDLVFYETDGVVSHVMMAIGDGQAINAANSRAGIIISDIDEGRAARACRVLEASDGYTGAADGASYTEDQLELIWAIVAQEDDTCYDGALAVISCAMNRADLNYGGYGTTALAQLTADGQFCYSPKISDPSYWMRRLGGRVPEFVKTAVSDCLTQGIRNNGYLNFRSGNRNGTSVPIGGNWYF